MKISRRVIVFAVAGFMIAALIAVVSLTGLANTAAKVTPTPEFTRRVLNTRRPTTVPTATETEVPTGTPAPTATMTTSLTETPQQTATSEQTFRLAGLSSPVTLDKNGAAAYARVLTSAGATCNLIFTGSNGKIMILPGTGTAQADVNGMCAWSWTIPGGLPTGTATVTITVNLYSLTFPMILK